MQLTQTFSPESAVGTAVSCGFPSNCSPSPLCLPGELSADPWSQGASREPPPLHTLLQSLPTAHLSLEPPYCPPRPMGIGPPRCPVPPRAGTPCRLSCGAVVPRACPQPLLVPVSPSQLCKSSLGIWFVSSWQCHPPKCHGMQKSMKTRGLGHVFLFVCMCQHFQWLRNVCL